MLRFVFSVLSTMSLIGWQSPAPAQEWARKMFQESSYNFGTVARGAKTEHRFVFKNLYRDDLHVASVRASCGCTTPLVSKDTLKTWEQGEIIAHFNTDRFLGKRGATLTVVFDRPQWAEVQLRVDGVIRSDVVVNPGEVDLGTGDQGSPRVGRATVDYNGPRDWRILAAKSDNPFVQVTATETSRQPNRIVYDLQVQLSEQAPAGYVNGQVTLETNDPEAKQIPVAVQGRILPQVSVSPNILSFGTVAAGKQATKQVVVRAKEPFRIPAIRCDDPELACAVPSDAKPMHLVGITFTAPATPGRLTRKILIETDLRGTTVELTVLADVVPPDQGGQK